MITFDISDEPYRHWMLTVDAPIATLILGVGVETGDRGGGGDDAGSQRSSLLRADIELANALQRVRFEHPEVSAVVITGDTDEAFCSGLAEIPADAPAEVAASVRAFRNELNGAIHDASAHSGLRSLTALNGSASGVGYELALATDEIGLVDDGRSAVVPSEAALVRLVEKGRVPPDRVDELRSCAEGVPGQRAVDCGLVDFTAPVRRFADVVRERAGAAGSTGRGPKSEAVQLGSLWREEFEGGFAYPNLRVEFDEPAGAAALTIVGPPNHECFAPEPGPRRLRSRWWPLALCRELDDALLLLRTNNPEVHSLVLRTEGDPLAVASADVALTSGFEHDWFVREVVLYWKRTLRRLDLAWQSVIALIEPGSCFVGTLLELAFAADRALMVDAAGGGPGDHPAEIFLTGMNFGPLPTASGLTRLESRPSGFLGGEGHLTVLAQRVGDPIPAAEAAELGLVTEAVVPAELERRTLTVLPSRNMT